MFSNLKPTFGSTANPSFGFPSNVAPNPFGQSAFGKAPTTVFGQPSTAFGATTAPLFGQANNQHGSMFSSATPSSFGQTVAAQPTFGSAMFGGAPAQPSSSGLFGTSGTSTFGQQAKTPSFGFGSNAASTGFFGQPQPAVQPAAQPTGLFGQSNTTLFGSTTGFGASQSNTQIGTAIKFTPVTGTDTMVKGSINQTISTRHHCITCMKEYEGKSLEELRWEDYQVNRKGPQQGTQPSAGLFGNMAQPVGSGLFGTNPASTSSTTLFGQQDNKVFGNAGTPGFGQPNTFGATPSATSIPGGLFGKPIAGFGPSTSTASTFPFASTAQPAPLFGTPTPSKTFGVQPQQTSIFGQSPGFAPSTFGGFGAQPNQNVGLFNQNKPAPFNLATSTSNTFGSFGPPAPLQNTLFSGAKTNPGFGGFGGTTTAPVFGQSSFGQPQQGGLFNNSFNKAPAPLFGQTNPTNNLGATGLSLGASPSLFGNNMNKLNTMFGPNVGPFNTGFGTSPATAPYNMVGAMAHPGVTAADQNQALAEQQIISMSATPYGLPQLLSNISELDVDVKDTSRATNPTELNALLNSVNKCQNSPPSEKLNPVQVYGRKTPMFDGLEHRDESLLSNVRIKNNPKRLVIRNKSIKSILEPPINIQPTNFVEISPPDTSRSKIFSDDVSMPTICSDGSSKNLLDSPNSSKMNLMTDQPISKSTPLFESKTSKMFNPKPASFSDTTICSPITSMLINSEDNITNLEESDSKDDEGETFTEAVESQEWDSDIHGLVDKQVNLTNSVLETNQDLNTVAAVHPTGITLTRPEYYTVPLLDELLIAEDGSCVVQGFTVGRLGYGNVCFPEAIDVSNINIDELVHFRHKEITIYPDDTKKPPVGQGLNRRAQITLDKVWPMDKKAKEHVTDVDSLLKIDYAGKLRRLCDKQNTRFVEYRPDTGSWVFRVEHFSKYGHPDSDDEEEDTEGEKSEAEKQLKILQLKQVQKASATENLEIKEQQKESEVPEPQLTLLNRPDEPMPYAGDIGQKKPSNGQIQDFLNIHELVNLDYNAEIDDDETDHYIGMDNYNMISPSMEFSKYSLMKSAFFEGVAPDYDDSESDICSSEGGILELSNYVSKMSPNGSKMDDMQTYDQALMLDIFEDELKYSLKDEPECLQLPAHEDEVKKYHSSVNNYNIADHVALKGQSYKVGWGRNMSFLCLGSKSSSLESDDNESEVKNDFVPLPLRFVTINKITNLNHSVFRNCLEDHLKCQFKSSKVEIINEMPYFTTVPGFKLLQDHQKVSTKSTYEQQIWNLCGTLWNEISADELLKFDKRTIRKRLFSSWLKSATNDSVTIELDGEHNMYYKILTHISGNHIKEASELALKTHNYNLSLLISQLPSNTSMRSCLVKQIIQWNECDMFKFVDSNLWKIYSLLAGEPYVDYGENSICAYEGMDWLRILGIFFWYIIVPGETVSFAVNLYESIFEEHFHTIKPRPDYKNAPDNVYDLRFELMKFYSDNGYSLTRVLNPATYTKDALDHRFSWLLLQTLISLNYGDISKQAKTHVHTQFAAQLEQMGLWHWAIFVILFIEDTEVRKVSVKDMLGRHVQLFSAKWDDYPAREKMIVNDFKIPEIWINSAKADLAVLQKNYREAIFYLCYSARWEEAHKLMMEHLVPDHFLYYEYDILINILTPLWENQEYLPDWEERGGLMYDFAKLAVRYNEMLAMSETEIIRDELVVFRAAIMSICNRFQTFNPETYMHDVCLGEMSARIMMMFRKLLFAIDGITENVCSDIARNAQSLAMTGDYLQQELNEILVDFISLYQQRVDH